MSEGSVQDEGARFAAVRAIVDHAVVDRVTPGGQLSVRWREGSQWCAWDAAFGALWYRPDSPAATLDTPYDLASVTKAFVALAFARLAARGETSLDTPLGAVLEQVRGHDAENLTLEQLASHRSELPAWRPFFQAVTPDEAEGGGTHARIVADVARTPREPNEGVARYSDLGYILLGEALSRITGQPLDAVVRAEVTAPLGLDAAVQYRGVTAKYREPHVAPTEDCPWRGRVVQGNVHDENAYALEGLAGHAGLFGTARALATLGRASLDALRGDASWFDPEWMARMVAARAGGSHRLGWDGKSSEASSAGSLMSAATFGHLGFTGTSLWCDPEASVAVALVSNRVHPTRENPGIRGLRVAVHDAVLRAVARG